MANELELILTGKDKATSGLKRNMLDLQRTGKSTALSINKNFLMAGAGIYAAVKATQVLTKSFINFSKNLIKVSSTLEQYEVRLTKLMGSSEEGNKVFQEMTDLAGRVPKTYNEIMASATNLSAVVEGGSQEIAKLMPIIVDISSASGIAVEQVTSQFIRMYSRGAAAAELFSERGINAALGFQAGVSYSAEETMNTIISQWEEGTGKFVGASNDLAASFQGSMSMMSDAWFQFRADIGEKLFENLKSDLQAFINVFNKAKTEGKEYVEIVEDLADFFENVYEGTKNFAVSSITVFSQGIDLVNEFKLRMQQLININASATIAIMELGQAAIEALTLGVANTDYLTGQIEAYKDALVEGLTEEIELRKEAEKDYSTIVTERVEKLLQLIEKEKENLRQAEAEKTQTITENVEQRKAAMDQFYSHMADQVKSFKSEFKKMVEKNTQLGKSMAKIVGQQIDLISDGMGKAMGQMILHGKNFGQTMEAIFVHMAEVFIAQITAMIAKLIIFKALSAATGVGGFLGGLFHQGGIVKAHNGMSIASDEVPILAQTGEGILSRRGMDALGGVGVLNRLNKGQRSGGSNTINIEINYPQFRGEEDIDLLLEQISTRMNDEIERL